MTLDYFVYMSKPAEFTAHWISAYQIYSWDSRTSMDIVHVVLPGELECNIYLRRTEIVIEVTNYNNHSSIII